MSNFKNSSKDFLRMQATVKTEEEMREYLAQLASYQAYDVEKIQNLEYDFGLGTRPTTFEELSRDISRPEYEIKERFFKTRNIYLTMLSFRQEDVFRQNAQYVINNLDCPRLFLEGFELEEIIELISQTSLKRVDIINQIQAFLASKTANHMTFDEESLNILLFSLTNPVPMNFYKEEDWTLVEALRSLLSTTEETRFNSDQHVREIYKFAGSDYQGFLYFLEYIDGSVDLTKEQVERLLEISNTSKLTPEQATELFLGLYTPAKSKQLEDGPLLKKVRNNNK